MDLYIHNEAIITKAQSANMSIKQKLRMKIRAYEA
jgi:hypothetical protein